jgi:hypothetical protein
VREEALVIGLLLEVLELEDVLDVVLEGGVVLGELHEVLLLLFSNIICQTCCRFLSLKSSPTQGSPLGLRISSMT